ncbi:hypothetical protein NKG94_05500 [Micromonospora sp. M12]
MRCRRRTPRLLGARAGYRVRDVDRGPDDDVEVTFQGPTREYELKVRCIGSEPVAVADD